MIMLVFEGLQWFTVFGFLNQRISFRLKVGRRLEKKAEFQQGNWKGQKFGRGEGDKLGPRLR